MDAVDAVSHSTVKVRSLKIKYMIVAFFFMDGYTGDCVCSCVYRLQGAVYYVYLACVYKELCTMYPVSTGDCVVYCNCECRGLCTMYN